MPFKTFAALIAAFCIVAASTPSDARPRYHVSQNHHYRVANPSLAVRPSVILDVAAIPAYGPQNARPEPSYPMGRRLVAPSNGYDLAEGVIGGRPSGCPHRYCGCSASLRVFGKIIPGLNLAANWGQFQSASPAPGMAAWRPGHVFIIVSVNSDGTVVAHDGNSGRGLTRIHTVSLRGYRIVNPNLEMSYSARKIRTARQ